VAVPLVEFPTDVVKVLSESGSKFSAMKIVHAIGARRLPPAGSTARDAPLATNCKVC